MAADVIPLANPAISPTMSPGMNIVCQRFITALSCSAPVMTRLWCRKFRSRQG